MSTQTTPNEQLPANAEATAAWDGPLFERFVEFREVVTTGLGAHGDAAIAVLDPRPGERVLDIGCGFGDATQQLARLVGPDGEAVGVDVSPRFIEAASREAAEAEAGNARFQVLDVEVDELGGPYDLAFSRFGTMFFAGPVRALGNIRSALKPGGRLVMVVWRRRIDNDWMYRGQTIVEGIVSRPEDYDEPTCGPGPFSMADADTTTEILMHAGFRDIALRRCDIPIKVGSDVGEAIDILMAIGPAGEILRLQGDRAAHLHDQVRGALEAGLREFEGPDGLVAPASTWIVSATAPSG
ncbi:MAG TPA: methyltransferase domain-containing protein [Solirubrobacteraceae bacterium]|nr:methyltransferase domain-containing protein [Solirubrobacteraceae bacterium]